MTNEVEPQGHEQVLVIAEVVTELVTEEREQELVELLVQGPAGPPGNQGADGEGAPVARPAGQPISALRIVWEDAAGEVFPLSADDSEHIDLCLGLTITAADAPGRMVQVQRIGTVNSDGLGLSQGRVWLGLNGALTQNPPASGNELLVGFALSPVQLLLQIEAAIFLE